MKKIFFALTTALALSATALFANPGTEAAQANFKKEFPGAELISWSSTGSMLKAVFIYGGYRSEAYFTEEGELQGSARSVFYSQLPLAVTKAVDKRFQQPDVLEVCEVTVGNATSYIIRLNEGEKQYKVQVDAGGNLVSKEKIRI